MGYEFSKCKRSPEEPRSARYKQNQNRSGGQSRLGLCDDGCKTCLVVDGHVGQHFTIDFNARFLGTCNENAVGYAEFTAGSVDTGDPESAECTLLVATVAVGILACTHDRLFGDAEDITAATAIAFRCFDDFFVTGAGGNAAFYAWDRMISVSSD